MNLWKWLLGYVKGKAQGYLSSLLYFASYPFLTFALVSLGLSFVITFFFWLLLMTSSVYVSIVKSSYDFKKAFYRMFKITIIPLVIFLFFNLGITAHYALLVRHQIATAAGDNNAARIFYVLTLQGYLNLVPKLWETAGLYAIMSVLFYTIGFLSGRLNQEG